MTIPDIKKKALPLIVTEAGFIDIGKFVYLNHFRRAGIILFMLFIISYLVSTRGMLTSVKLKNAAF